MFFFVSGCLWGGDGGALFQLWGVFSAEAGTFDFDRQYGVLAVFSRFGGFQKHEKSDKKVLGNLLFFALRKKRSGIDFSIFLGFLLDSISSPGLYIWQLRGTLPCSSTKSQRAAGGVCSEGQNNRSELL